MIDENHDELLASAEDSLDVAGLEASASDGDPAVSQDVPEDIVEEGPARTVRYSQDQLRRAREIFTRIYAIRRAARFYPMDHPAVTEGVGQLHDCVFAYHNEGVDLHLAFFEGEILLGDQLLTEESVLFDLLIRDMISLGVGSIVIRRGASLEEVRALAQLLLSDIATIEHAGGLAQAVASYGFTNIEVGSVKVVDRGEDGEAGRAEGAKAAYSGAVSLLRELDRLMRTNQHMSSTKVKGVVRSLVDNVITSRYAMLQLTGLKNYDEYTFYHSANVAILSLALGSMVTSDYRFLSSLGVGALMHDIGKLSVDLSILNKPGALTPEEWANVREHPVRGAQMFSLLPGVDRAAMVSILEHHMRFDGTGYPTRTPVRPQHLASRIVAVADSYDAMTSRRSYSAARVQDQAMSLLAKGAGSSLDPALVRLFIRLMGVYPPRSVVRLSEGQVAIVLEPSPSDSVRPKVRIVASADGGIIEPMDVDLTTTPELSVRGCIDARLLNIDVDAYL